MIGGERITSFTQGTPNANKVTDIYDELVDDLLRYPWNFATKRAKLAQSSTAPAFEFDYAYALPADWIYTVSVHGDDSGISTIFYREEQHEGQNSILTSVDQVYCRYVARVTDPNLMSGDFRAALTSSLARELAITVASSNVEYELMEKRAKQDLAKARSTDGLGSFPEMRPRGSWVNSRSGRRRDWIND